MRVIELRHTDQKLSLATVAREIGTSRRQLQRAFAETGGTSFRRELDRARMSRAAQLLGDESQSVKKVGAAVGYRYAAQFAKAFRRHHGVPPSSFRRDTRGDVPDQTDFRSAGRTFESSRGARRPAGTMSNRAGR